MNGEEEKKLVTPEIPSPKASQLIFIRHGHSEYTGKYPDLTPKGVSQVKKTATILKPHLERFDCFIVITSPKERAKAF